MNTSVEIGEVRIRKVRFVGPRLAVDFDDDRSLRVPLSWYPRLLHATPRERADRRFIAGGRGIHWPLLDEDISAENLLAGRRSAESPNSLRKWLERRGVAVSADTIIRTDPEQNKVN